MFHPIQLRVNRAKPGAAPRTHVVEGDAPLFSWGAVSDMAGSFQASCRVKVYSKERTYWDSGFVTTSAQEMRYAGEKLPEGVRIEFAVTIQDQTGCISEPAEEYFYLGDVTWSAPWIAAGEDIERRTVYFRKEVDISHKVKSACLYVCGLGYHKLYINGLKIDDALLDPAHTDYTAICQYVVIPEAEQFLHCGANCLGVIIGEGWRRNRGVFLQNALPVRFFGTPQLTLMLKIIYENGETQTICTDDTWRWGRGAHVLNNLFDGELYDANETLAGWNQVDFTGFQPVVLADAPGGRMLPMMIPPIREKKIYRPLTVWQVKAGVWSVDFGQNIAGVVRIRLPQLPKNAKIVVRHMELLDEDGTLYLPNLRGAKQTDTYIASGDERDLSVWQPEFTYHGFRYVEIEGMMPEPDNIEAVSLYTDMDTDSFFRCGSALVNQIQKNLVMTERDNMHSILTDCPQRDERMGWMNDATVRFEETPYNFDAASILKKIVRDLRFSQREDGAISCTSPYIYGAYPADPVCSSYLVAAMQALLHAGDIELVAESFAGFCAWEKCLLDHSTNYLVDYSYYGDWAAPAYACEGDDGAKSIVTPGEFMSTGYSYYNCVLLRKFAEYLDRPEDAARYGALAEDIRSAMLNKWYKPDMAVMATGSQACQAFSLWLGILPEEDRQRAAKVMRDDLVKNEYRFTTGNLCTRYLMDMLAEYGYIDDAWAIITSETYPSYGYMIQNEATTIWERFELKKNFGMNSHNHPMYGAIGYWFYAYIAGIRPLLPGYEAVRIAPCLPEKLLSAEACVDTVKGRISVRWIKRYGQAHLYVDVPFGVTAQVTFGKNNYTLKSGFHHQQYTLKTQG